ncbi:MAG: prephenate dehydrogenase/arogenate dehydrogenase family protein [Planctomycetia bacterium]|nr:prephenate dehydrogenase/arogenate dehydrogenase family protein [Planctomycetia bacterium]
MPAQPSPPARHQRWETVAIVGVGLIGGSIGIDLLRRGLAKNVVGIGRRPESLRIAQAVGACTSATLDVPQGLDQAQLIVVCTPVGRLVHDVRAAASFCRPDTLITDVGSTKAHIVAELDRELPREAHYVGSHPLAGGERGGPAAATAGLFEGRTVVVTPGDATREEDLQAITSFWQSLGATVTCMTPDEHDRLLAAASHLPHVAAAALAAATPHDCLPLVATGWTDTTRVAAGDPELWKDILLANRSNVLDALGHYEEILNRLRQALARDDAAGVVDILREAKLKRDAVGS